MEPEAGKGGSFLETGNSSGVGLTFSIRTSIKYYLSAKICVNLSENLRETFTES